MINKLLNWVSRSFLKDELKEIKELEVKNSHYRQKLKKLQEQLEKKLDTIEELRISKLAAEQELFYYVEKGNIDIEDLKRWYDNKWSNRNRWIYRWDSRVREARDVTLALNQHDRKVILEAADFFIDRYELTKGNTPEKIIENVIEYFIDRRNWTYVRDIDLWNTIEHFQPADFSWKERRGDCDSLAILMHNLIKELFIKLDLKNHLWRLKFTGSGTLVEGHAYNIWMGEDGYWYVIESTIDLRGSFMKTWLRTPINYNNLYGNPYGFADTSRSWAGSLMLLRPYDNNKT